MMGKSKAKKKYDKKMAAVVARLKERDTDRVLAGTHKWVLTPAGMVLRLI